MIGAEEVGHVGQVGREVGSFETEAFDNATLVISRTPLNVSFTLTEGCNSNNHAIAR